MKCGLPLSYEKIITPDGRAYHMHCWSSKLELDLKDVPEKLK
tara:strand:+ start:154 stop:279 length:126 start_codon:yes stop_codon:yes gene_type:complete